MARNARLDAGKNVTVHLPGSVEEQIKHVLRDPLTGKTHYGALSSLVTQLLRGWLQEPAQQKALSTLKKEALDTLPEIG